MVVGSGGRVVGDGRWLTVVVGGGIGSWGWWEVVVGGGRWWDVVGWWKAVVGGGRCRCWYVATGSSAWPPPKRKKPGVGRWWEEVGGGGDVRCWCW